MTGRCRITVMTAIVVVCALIFLSGCDNGDSGLDDFKQLLSDSAESEESTEKSFAEKVYLIIPRDCSPELSSAAAELAVDITERTDVETVVKYDNESIMLYKNDLQILIGATDRLISREAIEPLRVADYICRWDRGVIVLGGRHDDATVEAIEKFRETVLCGATAEFIMSEDAHFEKIDEYELDSIKLNGYDLYDYTLVYSQRSARLASFFREYIAMRGGYLPDLLLDSELDASVGKTVAFEVDETVNGAIFERQTTGDISVKGGSEYELSFAVATLAQEIMTATEKGNAVIEIPERRELSCNRSSVRLCVATAERSGDKSLDFITYVSDSLLNSRCDLAVFGVTDEDTAGYIGLNLENGYELISVERDGESIPVVYRSDAFTDVKCTLDGIVLTVDALCKDGEQYRAVRVLGNADRENIREALEGAKGSCALIIDGANDCLEDPALYRVCENIWRFSGADRVQSVFVDGERSPEGIEAETEKRLQSGYFGIFSTFDLAAEYCESYYQLEESVK